MSEFDSTTTLGELVAERPARASFFERLRLDFCCGGTQTLAEACAASGLDVGTVEAALAAFDAASSAPEGTEQRDWRHTSFAELCAHIVAMHHNGLREALPRIETLLAAVVRVHGARDPKLHELQRTFGQLRAELEPHLHSEEDVLFPACLLLEQHGHPVDEALLSEHEREHAITGDALAELRALGADYQPQAALCNTHRALLEALAALERDLHQHVHEENNILIPRVRELSLRPRTRAPEAHENRSDRDRVESARLPRCCETWIAEQTHRWATARR